MLPWVSTAESQVDWPYFKNVVLIPWCGNTFHQADHWIDQADPSFQGRPPVASSRHPHSEGRR
jgi:hypothetical protein